MTTSEDDERKADSSVRKLMYLLALVAVVGFYFSYIYQHAINVPLADDIHDVLLPLVGASTAEDAGGVLQALYEKHTDHRTIASRLVYSGLYLTTGEVNFRALNLLANLALPLLLLALYRMSARTPGRLLLLLPAALVLLQPRAYGITFWAMASFAYFYVFLYGFFCIILLHNSNRWRFAAAVLLATLANFTLASGQMLWLVGLASLSHQALLRRSISSSYLLWWLLAALITLFLWRLDATDRTGLGQLLQLALDAPGHYLLYTLTLLGSAVSDSSVAVAASTGAGMLVALCACSLHRRHENDLRLELCCWYIVLSVVAMVMGRGFATVDYGLHSRYSFPSVLLLASLWILLAVRLRLYRWIYLAPATLLALLYCGHSFQVYSLALQPYMDRRGNNFNRGRYHAWFVPLKESNAIVAEAVELGIYVPPPRPMSPPSVAFGQESPDTGAR